MLQNPKTRPEGLTHQKRRARLVRSIISQYKKIRHHTSIILTIACSLLCIHSIVQAASRERITPEPPVSIQSSEQSLAIGPNGTKYIAYGNEHQNGKATVIYYTGSSRETLGTSGFSQGELTDLALAVDSTDTPYVAYRDFANSYKATVMYFTGGSRQVLGVTGFSDGQAHDISLTIDNDTPYVAYQDTTQSNKATVMYYTGGSWQTIGAKGFGDGYSAYYTTMAQGEDNNLYLAYMDDDDDGRIRVYTSTGGTWNLLGQVLGQSIIGSFSSSIDILTTPTSNDVYTSYGDYQGHFNTVMHYDQTPPSLAITNQITTDTTPTLTGSIDDANATILIAVNGTTYISNNSGADWSVNITGALSDNTYTVYVTGYDASNNTGYVTGSLTIDTTAPTLSITNQTSNDTTPILTGTINDPTATVIVSISGTTYTGTNNGSDWTVTITDTLTTDGNYIVSITGTDILGNANNTTGSFVLDATAPTLTMTAQNTTSPTPTLTGTVDDASAIILVGVDGTEYAATNNGADWTVNITGVLTTGNYTVYITGTDTLTNIGTTTGALTIQSAVFCSNVTDVTTNECLALEDMYNQLNGANWHSRYKDGYNGSGGWMQDYNVCNRYGIFCSGGHIIGIDMDGSPIYNTTASSESTDADLSGSLVSSFTDLARLEHLSFQRNEKLARPSNITPPTSIKYLHYGYADLSNIDFLSGRNSNNLEKIYLRNNALTEIPALINLNTSKLGVLHIRDNNITSLAPLSGRDTNTLDTIRARDNQLTDISAFTTWQIITDLDNIHIQNNGYSGAIPQLTGSYQQIDDLDIVVGNNLCGQIPAYITDLRNTFFSGNTAETDVDNLTAFGGATTMPDCGLGAFCNIDADCASTTCTDSICVVGDTTAPNLTMTDQTTTDTTPTITGTVDDITATILIGINGTTYTGTNNGTDWSLAITGALSDNTYTVTITGYDTTSNTGYNTGTLTIDTTAPTATITNQTSNDTTPIITGTIDDGAATILVGIDGASYAATNQGIDWSVTITSALPSDGTYTVTITGTDTLGNSTTNTGIFTLDIIPPTLTVTDQATNDTTPIITGTISDDANNITLQVDGTNYTTGAFDNQTLTNGLLAHYSFDASNATDDSGSGHDGTIIGDTSFATGQRGIGAVFDGNGDYITISDHADLSFGNASTDQPFSVSAWVNSNSANYQRFVTKDDEWLLTTNSAGFLTFVLYDGSVSSNQIKSQTTSTFSSIVGLNTRAHITATYDGSTSHNGINLYIDGQAATQNRSAGGGSYTAMHNTSNAIRIGRFDRDTKYIDGEMDDVRIYSRELTAAEVHQLYLYGNNQTTWAINITGALAENTYTVYTTGTDTLSNDGNATGTLVIDTTVLTLTITDQSTTNNSPTITGTTNDASATILLTISGNQYTATNNGSDRSLTLTGTRPDDTYTIAISGHDAAHNTGTAVGSLTIRSPYLALAPLCNLDRGTITATNNTPASLNTTLPCAIAIQDYKSQTGIQRTMTMSVSDLHAPADVVRTGKTITADTVSIRTTHTGNQNGQLSGTQTQNSRIKKPPHIHSNKPFGGGGTATIMYKNTGSNQNRIGDYALTGLELQLELPPYTPPGTYTGSITITLTEE